MGNIIISGSSITNLKLGNNLINSVYIGDDLIYSTSSRLLDLFPADYAYSLRKLRTAYAGSCLRVRRTTTSPTTTTSVDVGFDSNDTISFSSPISNQSGTATTATTLGAFAAVGSNPDGIAVSQSLFVSTWYDQSGNIRPMLQTTVARQPRLVNSGSLETVDGSIGIRWVSSLFSNMAGTSGRLVDMSAYSIVNPINASVDGIGMITHRGGLTNVQSFLPFYIATKTYALYNSPLDGLNPEIPSVASGQDRLYEILIGPTTSSIAAGYSNGVQYWSTFVIQPTVSTSVTSLGFIQLSAGSHYLNGHIKEAIVLQGTPQHQFVEYNINSYYNIWS